MNYTELYCKISLISMAVVLGMVIVVLVSMAIKVIIKFITHKLSKKNKDEYILKRFRDDYKKEHGDS